MPDCRPAQEDLGAGVKGRQLAGHQLARIAEPELGAGTDSGTFDYFTETIVGEEGASRSDYTPSEDDNITVRGVSGVKGALGYSASPTSRENSERLKALAVDGGDGCVEPSVETVQNGSYKPLSRPLFSYVNEDAIAEKPALDPFLTFVLDNEVKIAKGARFVPMTPEQIDEAATALESGGVGVEEGDLLRSDRDHTITSLEPMNGVVVRTIASDHAGPERGLQHENSQAPARRRRNCRRRTGVRCGRRGRRAGDPGHRPGDGSSTVAPFAQAAAESYERKYSGARVVVGVSGTGGGFERFCKNETDLSNASRPIRLSRCHDAGIGYIQFLVANDGISLTVNRQNTWVNCLTTAELKRIWDRGSNVNNWSQVRQGFPNVPLRLFGPGTDSGTFEFFTEKINGRTAEPVGLLGLRGRQRPGAGCRGLSGLVLPREQEPPEGCPGERRRRPRHSERCERPEPHVQAALLRPLRLREEEGLQARRRRGLHPAHDRQ